MAEPRTLDPGLFGDTISHTYISHLFSALVQLTAEMDIVPDVAHSWQVLEGGRRYRIHLRNDVFWSDGIPVTAADFAFAWQRILTPENNAPKAIMFYTIKNASDFHKGRLTSWEEVGVNIADALTLEVTLEHPDSTFVYLMSQCFPVPRHRLREPAAPLMAWDKLVTNGPFRLTEWEAGQRLRLVTSPDYHSSRPGNVEAVEIIIPRSDGDVGRLALYEGDRLDVVSLASAHAVQARNRFAGDHLSHPLLKIGFVQFDCTQAPFADRRVRRALSLATDRDRLSEIFYQGLAFPASGGFIPPGMPGHVPGIALPYDPEEGRRLLAEAGYLRKGAFPPVRFLRPDAYTALKLSEDLIERWNELLGIEIEIEVIHHPWDSAIERKRADSSVLFFGSWTPDYPDPEELLNMSSFNLTGWRNEAYEALIQQARVLMDQEERLILYHRAQEILVDQSPVLPLSYDRRSLLIKPWVRRFPTSPIGQQFWNDVVIEPH
jgi:oligopeptide transport system substrate-binding protein